MKIELNCEGRSVFVESQAVPRIGEQVTIIDPWQEVRGTFRVFDVQYHYVAKNDDLITVYCKEG